VYWLHYVGTGLYPRSKFEWEARRLGVQRAVPFHMISSFEWGDKILLAQYSYGSAEVFGYFVLTGISHGLPKEVSQSLLASLNVASISFNGGLESRACGSYRVGSVAYINDSVKDLVRKVKIVCRDPEKYKWFLKGDYHPITPFILRPAQFNRGYQKVDIEGLNLELQRQAQGVLVWILDYERRTYVRKGARESRSLEEWLR